MIDVSFFDLEIEGYIPGIVNVIINIGLFLCAILDFVWRDVVPYRPRGPMVTHKIVFGLFKHNDARYSITQPLLNYMFSTRGFAYFYDLGLPIAATFCYGRNE